LFILSSVIQYHAEGSKMKNCLLFVMALYSSIVFAAPEIKGNPDELKGFLHPQDNLVVITESADEKAYSDTAIVTLVVTTEDKQNSVSMRENSRIRQAIVEKLLALGIAADKIKNSKFSSSPQYGWFGKKPDSFKIVNRVTVTISEESQLQKIAEIADSYPESSISSTLFEHSKKDFYQQKVKEKALEKVLARKVFYERSLGVKLTPASFNEQAQTIEPTAGAGDVEEVVVTGMRASGYSSKAEPKIQEYENSFDEIKYTTKLSVEFKIQ
jgi:uncharacterized protein